LVPIVNNLKLVIWVTVWSNGVRPIAHLVKCWTALAGIGKH